LFFFKVPLKQIITDNIFQKLSQIYLKLNKTLPPRLQYLYQYSKKASESHFLSVAPKQYSAATHPRPRKLEIFSFWIFMLLRSFYNKLDFLRVRFAQRCKRQRSKDLINFGQGLSFFAVCDVVEFPGLNQLQNCTFTFHFIQKQIDTCVALNFQIHN